MKVGTEVPQQVKTKPQARAEQQGAEAPAAAQDAAAAAEAKKAAQAAEAEAPAEELDRETMQEAVTKAIEAADALAPRRHLEYELVTDANMVQVHVVNNKDGSIVRKVPADDIIELVKRIQNLLSDRMDVRA